MSIEEIRKCGIAAQAIIGLGSAAFIMQFTNALISISCNSVLSDVGGDLYVSIMTMVNSARRKDWCCFAAKILTGKPFCHILWHPMAKGGESVYNYLGFIEYIFSRISDCE